MKPPGWEARLDALIAARRAEPFHWTGAHCLGFVSEAVEAITGKPTPGNLALLARQYIRETAEQAGRCKGHPFLAMIRTQAADFGYDPVEPVLAQRGDAVLLEQPDGTYAFAICTGSTAVGQGIEGLVCTPMTAARLAWRI